ncbi:MAG: MBL fold metallo-hydrolase [Candidatus Thiodiazotropha sp. (ex Dulcina madagascariensis)]|nr:MBL fold metallo-hydrolase [Candidatus Thiodiazotropha sp. (ex Dulcina madagascariensis)]MCU7937201.1 MBL fold metallo-hydrolase [Candidatus Thiodiazotropha sp. (ex Dulcina madagascariensis)]
MKKYSKLYLALLILFITYEYPYIAYSGVNAEWKNQPVEEIKSQQSATAEHHTQDGFQNHPFIETASSKGPLFYIRRAWHSIFLHDAPKEHTLTESEALHLKNTISGDSVTWLGHASFLIRLSGKTILTDPYFSEFASPLSWIGPRRMVASGISLENLPPIDIIIASHNHYDHLDDEAIRKLPNKDNIRVVVPLGLKTFFAERDYSNITELDWHKGITIENLELIALPAVHNSARSHNDHNKTLWASWAIVSPENKLYFIGDSGYSNSIFKNIGNEYGKFDYVLLPIGAYEPRELMWMSHMTPEEAVLVGKEVRADTLIASHWGTINLSDEPPWEPPKRFSKAGLSNGFDERKLWIMKIGETRSLTDPKIARDHNSTSKFSPTSTQNQRKFLNE